VADINEIEEQMTQLFEKIESPVLTDLKVFLNGVQVTDMFPPRLPDLFAGQPVLIYRRIAKGRVGTAHLSGRASDEIFPSSVAFDNWKAIFYPGVTTLWARQRVEESMDRWRESNEEQQGEIRSSVIAHAIRYRLVTRFTSLAAVEEKIVNPGGQSNTVSVATALPAGWKLEPVLGAPATGQPAVNVNAGLQNNFGGATKPK
jgi:Ca-activated chloride channel homolog